MANFSLDDIRAAAEKKFGSLDVSLSDGRSVRLVNALQLPKEKRERLFALQAELGEDNADQEALLCDSLRVVATDGEAVEQLIREVDGNLALLIEIFSSYNKDTEAGEA